MKKLTKELSGKSIKELAKQMETLRQEIAKLTLNEKVNPAKDTNTIPKKKKQLAVLLTILSQKKELAALEAKENK